MDWLDALVGRVVGRVLGHAPHAESSDEQQEQDQYHDGNYDEAVFEEDFGDSDSSSSDDSRADDMTLDQTLRTLRRLLRRDTYFDSLAPALRHDECDTACFLFQAFRRERRLNAGQQFAFQGLEYLMDPQMRQKLPQRAFFWGQHIEPRCRALTVQGHPQVFVVRRELDYVYSWVVEQALWLGSRPSDDMRRARQHYRDQKQRNMERSYVPVPQGDRCSPDSHVLYMPRSCALFQYCDRLLLRDTLVDYERASGAWAVEPLSFCLVNLLCHVTPAQELCEVSDYADWVAAPLVYLTLWNSGVTPTTQ